MLQKSYSILKRFFAFNASQVLIFRMNLTNMPDQVVLGSKCIVTHITYNRIGVSLQNKRKSAYSFYKYEHQVRSFLMNLFRDSLGVRVIFYYRFFMGLKIIFFNIQNKCGFTISVYNTSSQEQFLFFSVNKMML